MRIHAGALLGWMLTLIASRYEEYNLQMSLSTPAVSSKIGLDMCADVYISYSLSELLTRMAALALYSTSQINVAM